MGRRELQPGNDQYYSYTPSSPARVPKMSGRAREIERFRFGRVIIKLSLSQQGKTYKTIPRPSAFSIGILVSCYILGGIFLESLGSIFIFFFFTV